MATLSICSPANLTQHIKTLKHAINTSVTGRISLATNSYKNKEFSIRLLCHEQFKKKNQYSCLTTCDTNFYLMVSMNRICQGGEPASIWASRQIKQCSDSTALSSLARMLHEDILTDITINAADGSVRAHRAILATRSPVFRSMFSHDLREKELSTVDISDMTLDSCRAFLSYIYGDVRGEEFLANRLALLRAADKYDIDDLREACHESLLEDIDTGNVLERLQTAHLYRLPRLKGGCLRFLVDFRKVYEMHDDLNAFLQTADRDLVAEVFHGVLAAWSGR